MTSATRKAFHPGAPRPSFSCETSAKLFRASTEWHLAMPGRRGLCRYLRVHVMRIARAPTHHRFLTFRSRSKLSHRPKHERWVPRSRASGTPRFSDAVSMARFSNLAVAGPTATPRLLQHEPTYEHDLELPLLTLARRFHADHDRGQDPDRPASRARLLAKTNPRNET